MASHRRGRVAASWALAVALLLVGAACSDRDDGAEPDAAPATSPDTAPATSEGGSVATPNAEGAAPQPTLREAVDLFLAAQVAADAEGSFALLGGEAVDTYHDVAEWSVRLSQLAPPTGYEIEDGGDDDRVTAIVTHEPGLDPFIGLSAARERQTFMGVEADGGWLIGAEPEVELLLPPEDEASDAVATWAEAVQTCDQDAADALQAVDPIFGTSVGASELCGSSGAVETGPAEQLLGGPESADLIAQYSTDAIEWARAVQVTAPTTPLSVIVAPIGDTWQVIGVYD